MEEREYKKLYTAKQKILREQGDTKAIEQYEKHKIKVRNRYHILKKLANSGDSKAIETLKKEKEAGNKRHLKLRELAKAGDEHAIIALEKRKKHQKNSYHKFEIAYGISYETFRSRKRRDPTYTKEKLLEEKLLKEKNEMPVTNEQLTQAEIDTRALNRLVIDVNKERAINRGKKPFSQSIWDRVIELIKTTPKQKVLSTLGLNETTLNTNIRRISGEPRYTKAPAQLKNTDFQYCLDINALRMNKQHAFTDILNLAYKYEFEVPAQHKRTFYGVYRAIADRNPGTKDYEIWRKYREDKLNKSVEPIDTLPKIVEPEVVEVHTTEQSLHLVNITDLLTEEKENIVASEEKKELVIIEDKVDPFKPSKKVEHNVHLKFIKGENVIEIHFETVSAETLKTILN